MKLSESYKHRINVTITLTDDLISIRYNNSFIWQIESRAIKASMSSLNHTFSFCCLEVRRSISHKSSSHFTQETQALRYQSLVLTQTSGTPKGSSDLFQWPKKHSQHQFLSKNAYFLTELYLCLKYMPTTNNRPKNDLEIELIVMIVSTL